MLEFYLETIFCAIIGKRRVIFPAKTVQSECNIMLDMANVIWNMDNVAIWQ